jgi:integrase
MARKPRSFDDAAIAALPLPRKGRRTIPDTDQRGLYIQVTHAGARSFYVVTRDPNKKQIWQRIGDTAIGIAAAREKAVEVIRAIQTGADRGGPETFAKVAENWFKREVEAKGHRSARKVRLRLDKHLLPALGGRDFTSIRRGDVAKLLDAIEDNSGPVAADKVLAAISTICNWYATRNDSYSSPIVKGMKRSDAKPRDRILSDDELRAVWRAAEANGTFGAMVRVLLLTGQRREKVAAMRWQDIALDGTWSIPAEAREKGNAGELVLPEMALAIIQQQPRFDSNPYVFAGRRDTYRTGHSGAKAALDAKVASGMGGMPRWTLHDLRRTARSLMSRANVRPDIAERVLGHAIGGVEGIYDRHSYRAEKAHALKALASLIESILAPQDAKVRRLRQA